MFRHIGVQKKIWTSGNRKGKLRSPALIASKNDELSEKKNSMKNEAQTIFILVGRSSLDIQVCRKKYRPQEIARESFARRL